MATAPQSAMDKADLKRLLSLSKKEPVNCAIGMGKGTDPLFLLHKTKQPRAVLQEMEKEFGVLKSPCWGSAFVDTDNNPKLVVLTLNKGVSGLARKLVKTLKGTGFSKVEIKLDDGSVFESVGDEEDAEESEAGETQLQDEAPPPAPPPPPVDLGALRGELGTLIPQIPNVAGKDAAKLETLKKLAGAANAAVKAGDPIAAPTAMDALRSALAGGSGAPTPPPAPEQKPGEFVTMQKSRLIWDSARKRVASEIGGLKDAVRQEFDGDPEESMALDALDQLDEIMARFDERLIDTLDEMLNETDPAKRAELRDDAKELIGEYAAYADSNPLLKQLDGDTPLGMKLSIASTMTATLKALQASLR